MNTQIAIKLAGSKAQLARILGVSRPAVTQYGELLPKKQIAKLREVKPEWFTENTEGFPTVQN
jgi:DNA-binding transcriptional regulator YdaS (Cro superfamily)